MSIPKRTLRRGTKIALKKPSAAVAVSSVSRKPSVSAAPKPRAASVGKPHITSWGSIAEWYDRLLTGSEGTFQRDVILPNMLRLMELKSGTSVADIACGQGFFAAGFMHAGAKVVGADISPELIGMARMNAPGATFHIAPAHRVPAIETASVDHVTVVLAIQNIENDREVFVEAARMLIPGGKIHFVMNHPCFRIPKRSSWGWESGKQQYRRIDGYLTESRASIDMAPGTPSNVLTVSFHHPLQHYVKFLAKAGFVVTNMEEWISNKKSDSGPRAPEENRARREFPLFMYLQATKL